MNKWCILQTIVQLHVLLRMGKAEEVSIIPFIKSEISTSISSTSNWNTPAASWESRNVIDNKAFGSPDTCRCCSGTSGTDIPWIQIDLGMIYIITRIQITGRPDNTNREQFQDIYVFVSNTSFDTSNGSLIYEGNPTNYTRFELRQRLPTSFRYLVIRRFSVGFLTICEVDLFEAAEEVDIIPLIKSEVSISISSTSDYNTPVTSWESSNVIDNKATGSPDTCRCCAGTSGQEPPWIQIDLGMTYTITKIQITGSPDNTHREQFQNIYIFVSNASVDISNGSLIYNGNPTNYNRFELRQHLPTSFRYLVIRRFTTGLLTICEVELFTVVSKCGVGRFGKACSQKCHCADTNTCNVWTGNCKTPGCLSGWTGKACNNECAFRRFGINCSTECHCSNNSTCNKVNGMCTTGLCEPGWYEQSCSQGCPFRRFGINCSTECHCSNNSTCNKVNGMCTTGLCEPGWYGHSCSQVCDSGKYGYQCSSSCGHCEDGTTCNNVNGACYGGCIDGYSYNATDTLCKTPCDGSHFGKGCSKTCHCKSGKPCINGNGECPYGECASGWTSQACDTNCTNSTFGPNCANQCHCSGNSQCNIFQGNCSNDCDIGWAGFNCSIDLNIIRRNTTSATALQSRMYSTCSADRAIDGIDAPVNPSNDADLCSACSVAQNDKNVYVSWWQLNLGSMFLVRLIKIIGRPNIVIQSQNITGYINNISMEINQLGMMLPINSSKGHIFLKDLMEARLFRYLKIQKRNNVLILCEVKLYEAECSVGTFGDRCSNPCKCADKLDCNKVKGTCMSKGCLPGWEGAACNKSCSFPHFGDNCTDTCHCLNNSECDHRDGKCNIKLCEAGWQGKSCNNVCDHRRFGINCLSVCSCRDNTSCNATTGQCNTCLCDPGWLGNSCDKVCDHRRFGINCSSVCNCRDNTSCNATIGQCTNGLCDPGWLGNSCDKVCDHRRFGINCSSVCNCRDNTSCNAITGHCKTGLCDPGWLGNSCDKVCDHRRFGINCSSACNCRDNTSCDAITGHCKTGLCDPGWLGLSCDKGGNLIERIKYQVITHMSSEAQSTNSTFAVDGQLGPDPDKCQCCSITTNSPLSWWLLDLGKRYPLKSIIIYGRNKEDSYQQLTGFKLLLLNNTIDDKPKIFLSNNSLHTVGENRYEQMLKYALARYIKIERPGVLTLCEVIVIEGNCIDGTFGEECVQFCHCADNKPCQTIHGYCQSPICKLGWMGKSCNESCSESTFGEECKQVCYCEESTCSSDYGICPGKCRYGYRGVHCNIEGIEEIEDAKTADHSSAAVIGGSVAGGVVLIGILLLLVVLIYKQRMQRVKRNEGENYYKTVHRNMAQVDDETTYDTIDISHDNQDQQNEEDNVQLQDYDISITDSNF